MTITIIKGQEAAKSSNHDIGCKAKAAITEAGEGSNRSVISYRYDSDRINTIYIKTGDCTEISLTVNSMNKYLSGF